MLFFSTRSHFRLGGFRWHCVDVVNGETVQERWRSSSVTAIENVDYYAIWCGAFVYVRFDAVASAAAVLAATITQTFPLMR